MTRGRGPAAPARRLPCRVCVGASCCAAGASAGLQLCVLGVVPNASACEFRAAMKSFGTEQHKHSRPLRLQRAMACGLRRQRACRQHGGRAADDIHLLAGILRSLLDVLTAQTEFVGRFATTSRSFAGFVGVCVITFERIKLIPFSGTGGRHLYQGVCQVVLSAVRSFVATAKFWLTYKPLI